MRLRKALQFVAAAAFAICSVQAVNTATASATSYSGNLYFSTANGDWLYYYWDVASKQYHLKLFATAGMAPGKCLTGWFDWRVGAGEEVHHRDARAVRSCTNGTIVDSGTQTETFGLNGVQKLAICYGLNDTLSTGGSCNLLPNSDPVDEVKPVLPNDCTKSWEYIGSSVVYNDGGDPTKCDE
jgi:hypothetical protein